LASAIPFLNVYLVLVGVMLGSFINLAADRVPRRESLITPPSHCRACGRRLNAVDLLPVVGYLLRRGRCATCGVSIGAAAPFVEAISGAWMAVALIWLGPWPGAAVGLALVAVWGLAVTVWALTTARARPLS
jgi:prepilin signal peptidase PulO-like enzyme (type II secretory pathway)